MSTLAFLVGVVGAGLVVAAVAAEDDDWFATPGVDPDHEPFAEPNEALPTPPAAGTDESSLPDGPETVTVQQNPFYEAGGVQPIDCPAPPLDEVTTEDQHGYFEALTDCLDTAWEPTLASTGITLSSPALFVYDEPGHSPCGSFEPGEEDFTGYYCGGNQTIYVDSERMSQWPADEHIRYAVLLVHEYGHHVQHVTGMLQADHRLRVEHPDLESELSRRTEAQASCFAGMFINGVEDSYPVVGEQAALFEADVYSWGDASDANEANRTHGTPQTQGRWFETGFTANDTAACNSFVVSADEVE